jgi:hypothetical protein
MDSRFLPVAFMKFEGTTVSRGQICRARVRNYFNVMSSKKEPR